MAGGADSAVVDFFNPVIPNLLNNLRRKIDFVMRWANAGTELNDQIRRFRVEFRMHLRNRTRDNAELGSFFSGMNKADSRCFWIDNVNCAAIGDVNAERDSPLIGDQAVASREMLI